MKSYESDRAGPRANARSRPGAWRNLKARRRVGPIALLAACVALLLAPAPSHALMAGEGLMWSVLPDEPVKLTVCWLNPQDAAPLPGEVADASGATRREWIRLALKSSWERYARVLFVGWGECQDEENALTPPNTHGPRRPGTGDENIKVQITSSGGGQNVGHGSPGDFASPGVTLNLHPSVADNGALRRWLEFLAIHEFGHVLGYYHDEERQDWPSTPECEEQWSEHTPSWPWWPIPTEIRYGAPDADSVMAYCSDDPTVLSPRDIAGVQRGYQRHLPGTLLSAPGSQCLASHAAAPDGEAAFGWECDEAFDDQEWMFDPQRSALYIRRAYAGDYTRRCLDVDAASGTGVRIRGCDYGPSQQWQFRRILIRGYGGLCATRPADGPGAVTMQPCTGAATQLWRLDPGSAVNSFRLKAESAYVCLAARGGSGSAVAVESCGLERVTFLPLVVGSSQVAGAAPAAIAAAPGALDFHLMPGGELRPAAMAGMCLDVRDVWDSQYLAGSGGPAAGQALQVFGCYPAQINQKWNLSGDVVSGGKCLALSGNNLANGAGAVVARCDGSIDQDWDYYP
jgi:hypothetical protein